MKDPYLYEDVPVIRNKLNIKNTEFLEKAESDITYIKLMDIDRIVEGEKFDFNRLRVIHKYIFGDIYEWAGNTRTINIEKAEEVLNGKSVDYCDYSLIEKEANAVIKELKSISWEKLSIDDRAKLFSMKVAKLWQVHPFREGNTRTVMTFVAQFAEARNIPLDREMFKIHSEYVRKALVMSSIGQYSEYQYLIKIIKDSMKKDIQPRSIKDRMKESKEKASERNKELRDKKHNKDIER